MDYLPHPPPVGVVTGTAYSPAPPSLQVCSAVGMSLGAMGFAGMISAGVVAAQHILAVGNGF